MDYSAVTPSLRLSCMHAHKWCLHKLLSFQYTFGWTHYVLFAGCIVLLMSLFATVSLPSWDHARKADMAGSCLQTGWTRLAPASSSCPGQHKSLFPPQGQAIAPKATVCVLQLCPQGSLLTPTPHLPRPLAQSPTSLFWYLYEDERMASLAFACFL